MCGLFGIAGLGITQADLNIFSELGVVSMFRGTDGTGVFEANVNNKRTYNLMKIDEDYNYWEYKNGLRPIKDRLLDSVHCNYIMGHVRAATRGNIDADSCHPFDFPGFVAAHNGTLQHPKYIVKDRVDSELLFEDFEAKGIIDTLKDLTDKCAYAITLLDKTTKRMYFMNNGLRPLHFAINKKRHTLYWASEKSMLQYVLQLRRGEDVTIFTLQPGVWHTDLDKIRSDNAQMFFGQELSRFWTPKPVTIHIPKKDNVVPFDNYKTVVRTIAKADGESKHVFGGHAKCCGKHITPLEMWEMKNEFTGGWEDNGEYFHYHCVEETTKPTETQTVN